MIDRQAESEKPSAFAMPKKEEQAPAEAPAPAFSIPDAEIERILRHGSPYDGGKLRIAALYSQENTPDERVEYLKGEYGTNSGQSWQFSDGSRGGVQTRPQGLVIRDASHNAEVRLRWSEVEKRLGALIQNGQYLSGPDKQRYAALEKNYAEFGAVPLPAPGHGFPPTPADIYERYYPVIRDALLRDTAYRNACDNNDKETAYVEGGKAIEQAALTIQDTGFMRLYFDVPEYRSRLHQSLLDETYEAMTAAPELPDPPDRTSEMLTQAARMADGSNYAAPERFFLIETEGGYAVWDDIRDEIYVDPEGVSEEFTSEWQAEDYLLQVKEDVARQEAADWLKTEKAKLPPLKYAIGDPFTIYSEVGTKGTRTVHRKASVHF